MKLAFVSFLFLHSQLSLFSFSFFHSFFFIRIRFYRQDIIRLRVSRAEKLVGFHEERIANRTQRHITRLQCGGRNTREKWKREKDVEKKRERREATTRFNYRLVMQRISLFFSFSLFFSIPLLFLTPLTWRKVSFFLSLSLFLSMRSSFEISVIVAFQQNVVAENNWGFLRVYTIRLSSYVS